MTTGQKISEFIIRGETYIANSFQKAVQKRADGEDYEAQLFKDKELYSFLIELQSLYQQWTTREILQFLDYFDDEFNLKTLMGIVPDPYRHYQDANVIITLSNTLVVPGGLGFVYQNSEGSLVIYSDSDTINSYYGLV